MKQLWDKLAKENSKYYINSDYGKQITDAKFKNSGHIDFYKYIAEDKNILPMLFDKQYSILEIGCGTGRMTEFMADHYKKVIGIDISGEMIRQARERLPSIKFIETDGYTIPLEDNSIDTAFSYLVFQHFKTKEMIESNFREVYRVLKPKGIFKTRVRIDTLDNMDSWWSGVSCNETYPLSIGFKLLRKEKVGHYGLWLWLEK